MPDPRFYEARGPVSLFDLAALSGAKPPPEAYRGRQIWGVAVLHRAGPGAVSFLSDSRHKQTLGDSLADACFLSEQHLALLPPSCAPLVTALPQAAFASAALRLHQPRRHSSDDPPIHPSAVIEADVAIAPTAVIGAGAIVGRGSYIGPGAVIGVGVTLGRDCSVGANASLAFALVGDRVKIHAGAIIGEPGFGAALGPTGIVDIPQLGRVILQDGVTVGAGTCIDRGAFDDTVIGENTKIDNLVQIAHNVVVGRNCVLAAFTGLSGSVTVGDGCQFGGRVGVADHVVIGSGARIAGASGVMHDVPAGESWGGYPARPAKQWLRETAWLAKAAKTRGTGTS